MSNYNMCLEPGFCTAIKKGIFIKTNETGVPKNFTPVFILTISDEEDDEENANMVESAVQETLDDRDILFLTMMEVKTPMRTQEIQHQLKNFSGIAWRCFGDDSMIFKSLQEVVPKRKMNTNAKHSTTDYKTTGEKNTTPEKIGLSYN